MPAKKKLTARKVRSAAETGRVMDFTALVDAIRQAHAQCAAQANRAVNVSLTLRNWVIGCYVREYEQRGADRAKYGEALVDNLAEALKSKGLDDMASRTLRQCRQFYSIYPMIWQTASAKSPTACEPALNVATMSPHLGAPVDKLVNALSFSHLAELIAIDDPLKRAFYEIECIRGNWSVRALKRQIATLYFERSGLSKNKEKLAAMVKNGAETAEPKLAIRDPYIFEFLGLRAKDAVAESDLESALVENLREFLLELGHGFCLEAQQKSLVIGQTRGFVDLVFYHRILKCHMLVKLKVDEFRHEHLGQLNTYVTWYRKHMMAKGDNPPVGLLLCTGKDHALVQYATASMNSRLFVSKYAVELPSKTELENFITARRKEFAPDQPRVY
jgi:predicted nuclease of restriction endonuclease-like (RecB) superfamily